MSESQNTIITILFYKRLEIMNSFKETRLEDFLKEKGADSVVIAGMVTQACVMSTYYSAFDHGFIPYLAKGALISTDDRVNEAAEVMCGFVDVSEAERCLYGRP